MLAELAKKREQQKLKQAQVIQDVFSEFFLPHAKAMRIAFEKIMVYVLFLVNFDYNLDLIGPCLQP